MIFEFQIDEIVKRPKFGRFLVCFYRRMSIRHPPSIAYFRDKCKNLLSCMGVVWCGTIFLAR